eukprot:5229268-Amphidinium_carterae.1
MGEKLRADTLERAPSVKQAEGTRRAIAWKSHDEIMQMALYDTKEPVESFAMKLRSQDATIHLQAGPVPSAGPNTLFLAAAKAEHEEERQAFEDQMAQPVVSLMET